MTNPIERTSNMRAVIAYTWFDPERNFDSFYSKNEKQVRIFARDTLRVPTDKLDDFVMDYFMSAFKSVWVYNHDYPLTQDDDSEFLRRVKNRLWSFSSGWKLRQSVRNEEFISIEQSFFEDEEGGNELQIPTEFTLERELEGRQALSDFFIELKERIWEEIPEVDREKVYEVYFYMLSQETTCSEAIKNCTISTPCFYLYRSLMKEIIENMKESYI